MRERNRICDEQYCIKEYKMLYFFFPSLGFYPNEFFLVGFSKTHSLTNGHPIMGSVMN